MCQRKMKQFLFKTYVIEASIKMPSDVQEFDHIYLTDMADYQQFYDDLYEITDYRMTGKIHYIFGNIILFQLVFKSRREFKENVQVAIQDDRPYHVEFLPNRISSRVAHRAVDDAIKNQLSNYFINLTSKANLSERKIFKTFQWMNQSIQGNKEQKTAVRNIVNCTSFPAPYVIFGPPGRLFDNFLIVTLKVPLIYELNRFRDWKIDYNHRSYCSDCQTQAFGAYSCDR